MHRMLITNIPGGQYTMDTFSPEIDSETVHVMPSIRHSWDSHRPEQMPSRGCWNCHFEPLGGEAHIGPVLHPPVLSFHPRWSSPDRGTDDDLLAC